MNRTSGCLKRLDQVLTVNTKTITCSKAAEKKLEVSLDAVGT